MGKRANFVRFGPPVPIVPAGDFTKARLTDDQMSDLWWLCGPSAEMNMRRMELWQVIAMAYLEGLDHGSNIAGRSALSPTSDEE